MFKKLSSTKGHSTSRCRLAGVGKRRRRWGYWRRWTNPQPAQRPANVQPAPQNGEIKAPPEVTPKMERKLTGSVKLKSTVKYDIHRPSEKEQIDATFGAEHQRINDQRVAIMIDEIMAGMHEIYDGSIELEDNQKS